MPARARSAPWPPMTDPRSSAPPCCSRGPRPQSHCRRCWRRRAGLRAAGRGVRRRASWSPARPYPRGFSEKLRAAASDVAACHNRRLLNRTTGVDRPGKPDELRVRPRQGRSGERSLTARETWIARRRIFVPDLLGDHVTGISGASDRRQAPWSAGLSGGKLVFATLAGEDRPDPPDRPERVRRADVPRPAVARLAVPVVVEAVPERPVRGRDTKLVVDDGNRVADRRVVRALDAKPHELEEARVDDRPLVGCRWAAVADRVGRAVVRLRILCEAQVVRRRRVWAVGR